MVLGVAVLAPGQSEAQEPYVAISQKDCRRLVHHVATDDVTYQPGVDVRGKAVAPADLNANDPDGVPELIMPRTVLIPIEVDLFDRFGIPQDGTSFEADALIGEVTVDIVTGEAYFNGQPLQNEAEAELAARCREMMRSGEGGK